MNISEELDRSIGEGPPLPPPSELLPTGRSALARRRGLVGAAVVAVAVLVVGGVAVGDGLFDDTAAPGPAGPPGLATDSPSSAPTPSQPPSQSDIDRVLESDPVAYDDNGRLVISPRAHVVDRIDNPFGLAPPRSSAAVAAEIDGATYWFALVYNVDGSGNWISGYSEDFHQDFHSWAADQAGLAQDSKDEWPGLPRTDLVRFAGADGDRLEALDGVTLVRQVPQPALGSAWAGPDARSAAAEVIKDGKRYYVLARAMDDKPAQYIAVSAADGGASLPAFLDLARDLYAEGGGGLL